MRSLTVESAIAAARARNHELKALLRPLLDEAEARAREPRTAEGPLARVPYTLKDVWDVKGLPTTAGSYRHRGRVAARSSKLHQALEGAGAILIGKTNLSDLALSAESDNFLVGATSNPHDITRTAGGSSGGAAAAIASGMSAFDWGSDFGGSIRLPAAFCGIAGMRLSHAAWSPSEHVPPLPGFCARMNGMGPLAASARDLRTLIEVLAPVLRTAEPRRFEPRGIVVYAPDARASGHWPRFEGDVVPALSRLGLPISYRHELPPPAEVEWTYNLFLATHFDHFVAQKELPFVEGLASAVISVAIGGRGWGKNLYPRTAEILLALMAGFVAKRHERARWIEKVEHVRRRMDALWGDGRVVVSPVTTFPAPRHGKVLATKLLTAFTKLGNLADATALAVPFGRFPDGLPRAIQLLGPPGSEEALLDLGERL